MSKPEDTLRIIKTANCKTLSGKSTLTYQIGVHDDESVHVRISKNTGGGFFSDARLRPGVPRSRAVPGTGILRPRLHAPAHKLHL